MDEPAPRASRAVLFGASGGIGGALARALVASGRYATIYAGARRADAINMPGVIPFAFDLTDETSIAAAAAMIGAPVDLVIVASGILQDPAHGIAPEKSLRAIDPVAMARVFAVNSIGPALIAKYFLPLLARNGRSMFAALSARVGSISDNRLGGWHAYRASKAALNMLITNFAVDLKRTRPEAIAVALHPGTVATSLSADFRSGLAPGQLQSADTCAAHLLSIIETLQPEDSGGFFAWDGQRIGF